MDKVYDVTVWGATGTVGRLICENLATHYTPRVKWAMAGRTPASLQKVKDQAIKINPACKDVGIMIGDITKEGALDEIVKSTHVVIAAAGPYTKLGGPVVDACVRLRAHYVDLTAELPWMRDIQKKYHDQAVKNKVKIVHSCGFDSIPSDIGALFIADYMQTQLNRQPASVRFLFGGGFGTFAAGTLSSLFTAFAEPDKDVQRINEDPYNLNPPDDRSGPDKPDSYGASYYTAGQTWICPFVMAPCNTRVVRRSQALLGHPFGKSFSYAEGQAAPNFAVAYFIAGLYQLFGLLLFLRPLKSFWIWLLPRIGVPPGNFVKKYGSWDARVVAESEPDKSGKTVTATAILKDKRDPGYYSTARLILEAALCLALQEDQLAAAGLNQGGCLTPASAVGLFIVDRLRAADLTFDIESSNHNKAS